MAPTRASRSARSGRYWMVAVSVARLTDAVSTPGVLRRNRSIRLTHDAQVMPSMGRVISVVASRSVGLLILPGSIPPRYLCETRAMLEQGAVRTSIPGPWGPFHLAATTRGIVAVEWSTADLAFET